jgi:hypothetical protein
VRVELRHREYDLALFLFRNIGRLLSREHLYEEIWGADFEVLSRSLDTHLSRVRAKLDLRPSNGFMLVALRSFGYRLDVIDGAPHAAGTAGGPAAARVGPGAHREDAGHRRRARALIQQVPGHPARDIPVFVFRRAAL